LRTARPRARAGRRVRRLRILPQQCVP
jgi:hypothetical protein